MTCCFLGHRAVIETEERKEKLTGIIEKLITQENVDIFLFGSKSGFDNLCLKVVTELKEKYPHIRRVYVRAEYPHISQRYQSYLLEYYEETYYPERIKNAGRASYVERNYEMIDNSDICIFCYDRQYAPTIRKSGTKIALDYALKRCKRIIKV